MKMEKLNKILKNPVKKEIMEFLLTQDGAFYGDLVMKMDENQLTILEHLIELKRMGFIYKDMHGGRFRINDEYFIKKVRPDEESPFREDEDGEWTVIDEMNDYSEATRSGYKRVDNEISMNKLAPGEQKVRKG